LGQGLFTLVVAMLTDAIEVYRSTRFADCEERAFMLTAVGVPNEFDHAEGYYRLWVDASSVADARAHLARYQIETRKPAPAPVFEPPRLYAHAWIGCVVYAAVLLGVAVAVSKGIGRLDTFELGELNAARVQSGEWWRAWTALTLHLDPAHLAANAGAGIWFGYLAGRLTGPGVAWALVVSAAAAANLFEALLSPPTYRSVGASTAVFAALGMAAAYTWRERYHLSQRWSLRWGPLVAGTVLLGWMGTEGEHTDVFAHLSGFAIGGLLGALAALPSGRRLIERTPQWLAGLIALGSVLGAWLRALFS
jgi:rhomboid protease GluP